jgi:hypothetical protein
MSIYDQNKAFFSQPYRLTAEQMQNPVSVFENFFDTLHLHQVREELSNLIFVALTCENETYDQPMEREDLLYLRDQLEEVLEAAWLVWRREKQ